MLNSWGLMDGTAQYRIILPGLVTTFTLYIVIYPVTIWVDLKSLFLCAYYSSHNKALSNKHLITLILVQPATNERAPASMAQHHVATFSINKVIWFHIFATKTPQKKNLLGSWEKRRKFALSKFMDTNCRGKAVTMVQLNNRVTSLERKKSGLASRQQGNLFWFWQKVHWLMSIRYMLKWQRSIWVTMPHLAPVLTEAST